MLFILSLLHPRTLGVEDLVATLDEELAVEDEFVVYSLWLVDGGLVQFSAVPSVSLNITE